ncbi:transporter substrate-binding domain-containing protein [Cognatishimia activa]|uniref:transporter substrate-binding domain-containing protein n=1 Tax=Cognatishimia activa TaxID=1715691 RepID=UPI0006F153CE|nr:transporter substrate-binding domain-containing protein [Cognatishimia activa]CUI34326.1 Glutamine-binding periplasmic protein precursor [Cognatishimia activa]
MLKRFLIPTLMLLFWALPISAQSVSVATVERKPFSYLEDGAPTGFSIELMELIAEDLGYPFEISYFDSFADMLGSVEASSSDVAIANISITASREQVMDFSHPIFESGLQIMVPKGGSTQSPIWTALASKDLLIAIVLAFAMLFGGGMLMWVFERKAQPYFDRPAKEAMFPSFWWALNLVVNGGFEERVPRSFFGRIFAVLLVLSSLFIVSVFVPRITAVMTVEAINENITSVNDLYGREVGTIEGSTAASFLGNRDIAFVGKPDLDSLKAGFAAEEFDAVVFDAPVLAFYAKNSGEGIATLTGPVFLRENYGIAMPSGSTLKEPINQSLLKLRENGEYDRLRRKWFGSLN